MAESNEPVIMYLLSLLIAIVFISSLFPFRIAICRCDWRLHTRTVLSREPEIMYLESADTTTQVTELVCP